MNDTDYTKLLLDSSFKEANLFWIRNSAITVFQSIIVGFFLHSITDKTNNLSIPLFYIVCILGIGFAILHLKILCLSEEYNLRWFKGFKQWVESKKEDPIFNNLMITVEDFKYEKGNRRNVTTWMRVIPFLLIFFWVAIAVLKLFNLI